MRPLLALLAVSGALALTACGGGEPVARAGKGPVEITLDDFSITPRQLRATAGRITFRVANEGRLGHNFHLRRGDGEPLEIPTIFPGDAQSATARLPRGDYRMVCTVANHEELGMTGVLVLR